MNNGNRDTLRMLAKNLNELADGTFTAQTVALSISSAVGFLMGVLNDVIVRPDANGGSTRG